jgi:hypothetical protein
VCLCTDTRFRANHGEEHNLRDRKICDFLLFIEGKDGQIVAPIEFKGARPDIDHAAKQLQTGAEIAEIVLDGLRPDDFSPRIISRKTLKPDVRKRLSRLTVSFQNQDYPIRRLSCGDSL